MKQVLLGLLVGLIVGAGIGSSLLSPDPVAQEIDLAEPGNWVVPSERAVPDELRAIPAPATRSEAPRAELRALPIVSRGEIDAAIAATQGVEKERSHGSGVIHGTVLDPDKAGVGRVLIRARLRTDRSLRPSDPSRIGVMPSEPSLKRSLQSAAESYAASRARSFEATTNSAGKFRLEGLADGRYTLTAHGDGYWITKTSGAAGSYYVRTGEEVEFLAKPIVEIPISVRLAGGAEVQAAIIRCSDRDLTEDEDWSESLFGRGENEFSWSPAAPTLRLPAGTVHLKAFARPGTSGPLGDTDGADFRSPSLKVELAAGSTPPPVVLELEGRSGIRGRLNYHTDHLQGMSPSVHLMPIPIGGALDLIELADSDPSVHLFRNNDEFSFLDLEPGRYAVGVTRDWGAPVEAHQILDVGVGVTTCDLELPPIDPKEFLMVTVLRPDGELANNVRFGFTHRSGGGSSSRSGGSPPRTKDGIYVYNIPGNAREAYYESPSEEDSFSLKLRSESYGDIEVSLTPGQSEVSVTLLDEATLIVVLLGYAHAKDSGRFQVRLQALDGAGIPFSTVSSNSTPSPAGECRFDGLSAQRYRVKLSTAYDHRRRSGGWLSSIELTSLDTHLSTGENSLEFNLPPLYSLDIYLVDAKPKSNVNLERLREGSDSKRTWQNVGYQNVSDDGYATIDRLPAGEYRLRRSGPGMGPNDSSEQTEITVPCGTVTLTPKN
jgi:hypothetical protein